MFRRKQRPASTADRGPWTFGEAGATIPGLPAPSRAPCRPNGTPCNDGRGCVGCDASGVCDSEPLPPTEAARLPSLPTIASLAVAIGLSFDALSLLITGDHYTTRQARHGHRTIAVPSLALAFVQRWILRRILRVLPPHPAAHGVTGRSQLTAVTPHLGAECLITLDLASWFDSITVRQVELIYEIAGYSGEVAEALAALTTYRGALPQGPCTSPYISNLAAVGMDADLSRIDCGRYTRYADDLIISGPASIVPESSIAWVRTVARMRGWRLNESKTRVMLRSGGDRMIALGLLLSGDRPTLLRSERRRLRAVKHQTGQMGEAPSRRDAGRLAYAAHVERGSK